MKNKFYDKKAAEVWCSKRGIKNFTVKHNGTVNVDGSVYLNYMNLKCIPVRFGRVKGTFDCSDNALTNLEGTPRTVEGDFVCDTNHIKSLVHGPASVWGDYSFGYNQVAGLAGLPDDVGSLTLTGNRVRSLVGLPKFIRGSLLCYDNPLRSYEGLPAIIHASLGISVRSDGFDHLPKEVVYSVLIDIEHSVPTNIRGLPTIAYNICVINPLNSQRTTEITRLQEVLGEYVDALSDIDERVRRVVSKDATYAGIVHKHPRLAPWLFPDGNVPDPDPVLTSITDYL